MEATIERDTLLKAVSKVQGIIERKGDMPVLSTILLSAQQSGIEISATDLELGFRQRIPAEVKTEGSITVSGRKLFEILKESHSLQFRIKQQENARVLLTDGVARFELGFISPDDFPSIMEPEDVTMVPLQGKILSEMIQKTIYAITVENVGSNKLSGIFTEKIAAEGQTCLRMVATDGHRLSLIDKSLPDAERLDLPRGVMIPKKGMNELNKMAQEEGALEIGFRDNNCVAKREDSFLLIRLLDAKFPDYRSVIPGDNEFTISFQLPREVLLEGMRKMLILSSERYRAVKVQVEAGWMELTSSNPELGEGRESIDIEYSGDSLVVGFNPKFFAATLQAMESKTVRLSFVNNSKPCILTGEADQGFLGLIMPMRI